MRPGANRALRSADSDDFDLLQPYAIGRLSYGVERNDFESGTVMSRFVIGWFIAFAEVK